MQDQEHILYVVNLKGHPQAIQLSTELWAKVEDHVKKAAQKLTAGDDPFSKPQALEALEELKQCWDFTYPYEASMHCDACGKSTDNWEDDQEHPFHLTNANFGGLMVFQCRCGATIRKMHFHRKVDYECTPKQDRC